MIKPIAWKIKYATGATQKKKKKKKKERKKKGIRVCTLERARSQTKFADTRKKMAKEKEAIFGDKKQVLSSV